MIAKGRFTIWFKFGQYDVMEIVNVLGPKRAVARDVMGVPYTVRFDHCYGSFADQASATKSITVIRGIHKRHSNAIDQAQNALNSARKARNDQILQHLKGLK